MRRAAIVVVLLAVLAGTAPPTAAQARPTVSATIRPQVVAELDAAGVTLTGSRGATVRREGDVLRLTIPVLQRTAVVDEVEESDGFAQPGDQRITTSLLGRLTISNARTGRSVVLRDLQGVAIRGGAFDHAYLNARTSPFAPRFRIAQATNFPVLQGMLLADPNLAMLASFIAEAPVIQDAIPVLDPPLYFFAHGIDVEALVPPGAPAP